MAKLKGAAKQAFLDRINKGRRKAGLKTIKSKTKSVAKKVKSKAKSAVKKMNPKKKGSSSNKSKGSNRSLGKRGLQAKNVAKKVALGAGIGIIIRLATMFFPQREIREVGTRVASIAAATQGPFGETGYQVADAAVSRLIVFATNGGGSTLQIPNPLGGGA